MASEIGEKEPSAPEAAAGLKRRGLLRFGSLLTALSGASAISALGARSAHAGPGDKNPPTNYVPIAEKGVASGVATLDLESKIPSAQLPDLSATYVGKDHLTFNVLDYGVIANNSSSPTITANEDSIEAAAAALAALGGGDLYFPRGKYFFHHINIASDNVTLRGEGDLSILAPTYLSTDNVQAVRIIGNNVGVRDLKIEAQNKLGYPQSGFGSYELLKIGGTNTLFKSGVTVDNVTFVDGGGCNLYRTEKATIRNSRYTASHGNSFGSVEVKSDVLIQGNTATDGNDDLIAVTCDANVPGGTQRVVVTGNNLARTDAKCIGTSGIASGVIANNHCEDSFAPAIQVFTDTTFGLEGSNKVIVANNIIQRAGKWFGVGKYSRTPHVAGHGIHLAGDDLRVIGNSVFDANVRGINFPAGTRFAIEANHVYTTIGVGIYVGNPDDTTFNLVSDGKVSGNTTINTRGGIYSGSGRRIKVSENNVSGFKFGETGESRGIYYGYLEDSVLANNSIVNTDGANYGFRIRPGSTNPQTRTWSNAIVVPGAGTPDGEILTLGRRIGHGTAAPNTGVWAQGDIIFNTAVSNGAGVPLYWVCVSAGTPGTWLASAAVNILGQANTWSSSQIFNSAVRLGAGGSTLGFYGVTGSVKQTLAAAATDAATTQTLANDLRAKLIALGLFS